MSVTPDLSRGILAQSKLQDILDLMVKASGVTVDGELWGHGQDDGHLYCGYCGSGSIEDDCPVLALAKIAKECKP